MNGIGSGLMTPLASALLSHQSSGRFLRKVTAGGPLSRFYSKAAVGGQRITLWGDSTTQIAISMYDRINSQLLPPMGEWDGAVVTNNGYNGQTVDGALAGTFQTLKDTSPDVIVMCFGLNNVRLGGETVGTLQAKLEAAIQRIQLEIPSADIVLWTPNSILSTDPNNDGWVVPVASAQAYTDIIWNAHNNIKVANLYQNVSYLDKQLVFGRTSQPTSALMTDMLHPSNAGQLLALEPLIELLRPRPVAIDLAASAAAWAANNAAPWTLYPRALEDTRYATELKSININLSMDIGSLLIYFGRRRYDAAPLTVDSFTTGDLFKTKYGVYTVTGSEGKYNLDESGGGVQMSGMPVASFPIPVLGVTQNAKIYRRV